MREWQKAQRRRPAYYIPSLPKLVMEKNLVVDFNWHFIARRTRDREAKPPPNMAEDAWAPSSKWLRFRSILLVFCLLWRKQHNIEPALPPKPARRAGLFWSRLTATCSGPGFSVLKLRHAFIHAFTGPPIKKSAYLSVVFHGGQWCTDH